MQFGILQCAVLCDETGAWLVPVPGRTRRFLGSRKSTNTKRKRLQEIRDDWLFVAGFRQIENDVELRRVNRLESKKKKVQNIINTNAESFFYRNVRSTRNPQ